MLHFEKCNDCCVWMDAGVLSYKRCDRNFDCEHCPLDSVLQTEVPDAPRRTADRFEQISAALPGSISDDVAALLEPYASSSLHRDFFYTNDHVWVQTLPGGFYRVGLDAFLLRLLPDKTDIITLASGSGVLPWGPLGWMYMDGTTVKMRSPIGGAIVRRNTSISRVNEAMRATPYSESWLAVIKGEGDDLAMPSECFGAQMAAERNRNGMAAFLDRAATALADPSHLGLCMNDGGIRMDSLELALGKHKYREIIQSVLQKTPE